MLCPCQPVVLHDLLNSFDCLYALLSHYWLGITDHNRTNHPQYRTIHGYIIPSLASASPSRYAACGGGASVPVGPRGPMNIGR